MIFSCFQEEVANHPNRVAFVLEEGQIITYAQAEKLINNLAGYLSGLGVKQGDRLGFITSNESLHYPMLLALDALNASYVGFDLNTPKNQLDSDISKLNLPHFIVDAECSLLDGHEKIVHKIDPKRFLNDIFELEILPIDPVIRRLEIPLYLISSSGSMGEKKWMEMPGFGLEEYWLPAIRSELKLEPGHKMLCTRSPGYDARIFEYLVAMTGGELHCISRHERKDLDFIVSYCEKHKITEVLMIASQLSGENLEEMIQRLAKAGLRSLMVTGDACSPLLQELCIKYGINLVNCYGPTETLFGVSMKTVNHLKLIDEQGRAVVPIGKPHSPEVELIIQEGRVYIKTIYGAKGYLDNPTKTAEAFPLIKVEGKSTRVFDTGDSAEEKNGLILFKGRHAASKDIKIAGVKVDLFDCEQSIREFSNHDNNLLQVCVVSKRLNNVDKLVCYLVIKTGFNKESFLKFLNDRFKPEARPQFIVLEKFPVMERSDKIDRQSLRERIDKPEETLFANSSALVTGKDALTNKLVEIWTEILGFPPQSLDDDFEIWGGSSIDMERLSTRIRTQIDPQFKKIDLLGLETKSINAIAKRISNAANAKDAALTAILTPLSGAIDPQKTNFYILPHILGSGGKSSYSKLADSILESRKDINIFGLTDPGLHDSSLIDKSFDELIDQYVNAIIKNEPKPEMNKTIHLSGFSFGCFLAYHVSLRLVEKGYKIREMHLIDGFPPLYYRLMTRAESASWILNFHGFIAEILNEAKYGESIQPFEGHDLKSLDKVSQIVTVFKNLMNQVHEESSQRILRVAQQHLIYIHNDTTKDAIHLPMTRLYFSNPGQEVFQVLGIMPDIFYDNQSNTYAYWDAYFLNITKCSTISKGDHLDLIHDKSTTNLFFSYEKRKRSIWKSGVDTKPLNPLVVLQNADNGKIRVTICHLILKDVTIIQDKLEKQGFDNILGFHHLSKKTIEDNSFDEQTIAEFALTLLVDECDIGAIVEIVKWQTLENVKTVDNRMAQLQEIKHNDQFVLQIQFYSEKDLVMETVTHCYGNKNNLMRNLEVALAKNHAKITTSVNHLKIDISTFHDEHSDSELDLVNRLIRKISPFVIPFAIEAAINPVVNQQIVQRLNSRRHQLPYSAQ